MNDRRQLVDPVRRMIELRRKLGTKDEDYSQHDLAAELTHILGATIHQSSISKVERHFGLPSLPLAAAIEMWSQLETDGQDIILCRSWVGLK